MMKDSPSLTALWDYGFINYNFDYNDSYYGKRLSDNAQFILESRYLMNRYDSIQKKIIQERTYYELCKRVSRLIASAETLYTDDVDRIYTIEKNIFSDLWAQTFIFNSPALFNLGIDITEDEYLSTLIYDKDQLTLKEYKELYNSRSKFQMCFACFVIPVDDNIEGIYDSVKNAAIISARGGGVGTNFGRIREKGSSIRNGRGGISSGLISWMKQWETMGEEVVQGGRRRAALMGMLDINHPDKICLAA